MSATILSQVETSRTQQLSREIGGTFRAERQARKQTLGDVARALGMRSTNVDNIVQFEHGRRDVRISSAIRNLGLFGYTLAVVPIGAPSRSRWTTVTQDGPKRLLTVRPK